MWDDENMYEHPTGFNITLLYLYGDNGIALLSF